MKQPRLSLTKLEILRGYHAFSRVITEGKSLQRGAIRCFYLPASEQHHTLRVGFSVSRSVRNAVVRNRARRWMKEAYRKNKKILVNPSGLGLQPVNIIFMLRVRGDLSRARDSRAAVDQAIVALLKELHQNLSEKP